VRSVNDLLRSCKKHALVQTFPSTVAASLGSACHSEHDAVSGVLAAMGIDATRASGAVRLSVGRSTSTDDIDRAATALVTSWSRLTQD
jgi:cysteine desulfurase